MVDERVQFSKIYNWQAVVTMVLMPFLNIPEVEIWLKPTKYVMMMYGMYLKDQDAKEAEAKKRSAEMEAEMAKRRVKKD